MHKTTYVPLFFGDADLVHYCQDEGNFKKLLRRNPFHP